MEFAESNEVMFEENPRSKINRHKFGFALVFATVFCVLLLIACIVLAVLYSRELNKTPGSQNVEKYEICDNPQCFRLGYELVENMNKSVDPCEDFYAYACGGWQRKQLTGSSNSITYALWEKNANVLKKALEQAYLNYPENDAVMKTVRVYNSCLNTAAIDALGLQPLNDLIKQYGGWSISQNYDPTVTVAQRIGRAARDLNIDSLFGIDVIPNLLNSDVTVLMLKESALGIKKKYYLDHDDYSKKKRKEYKNYMEILNQFFHVSYAKMEAIYDFEVKLAKIVSGKSSEAAVSDYIKTIAKPTTTKLTLLCQETGFPWPVLKEVLDILFHRQLTGKETIVDIPEHRTFLKAISLLYSETNHALLADYIMWQVVRKYVGVLPNQYRPSKLRDLLTRSYWPRWMQCIYAMLQPFDLPLGLLYVDTHFNDDARVEIKEMIENTRTSFIQKLPTQTWMDEATQEMAKQKALGIAIEKIGYPDYIKDPAKLKAQYDSLNVTDSLMENMKAANHFSRMRTLKTFERPVDKTKWTSVKSPAEVNGFYSPYLNKIIFFAGILQTPFYCQYCPRYINYGAIGTVIGHEITHAFDGTGRLYDKNGNVKDWWSASSATNFESKSKCFVKQYNKYKIFDKHANGTKTLDENIADNGGIKLAYDAYQRGTKKNGWTEKILPGLDLNPNQLFFLGFAQPWCRVYSKDEAYNELDTDEHSKAKYRVMGSLSNYKKFSEVFKCSPNSGMNPVDKCEIW